MLLTRHSDFSVRLLTYLAVHRGRQVTVEEVARIGGMSRNHLGKISQELARLKYIATARGKGGGIRLAREPGDIRIGELVSLVEENLEIVECEHAKCPIAGHCEFKKALMEARDCFIEVLDRYTIADFVVHREALRKFFGGDALV